MHAACLMSLCSIIKQGVEVGHMIMSLLARKRVDTVQPLGARFS